MKQQAAQSMTNPLAELMVGLESICGRDSYLEYMFKEREFSPAADRLCLLVCEINKRLSPNRLSLGPNVVSIACGDAREGAAIRRIFKDTNPESGEYLYTGIDIDGEALDLARKSYALGRIRDDFRFLMRDLGVPGSVAELCGTADLVIARHNFFISDPSVWSSIFKTGFELLNPEGHFVITSFTPQEHLLALRCIAGLGHKAIVTIDNPYARTILRRSGDLPDLKEDGWVSVFGAGKLRSK